MSLLECKGYRGTIETEDDILFGHVLGLKNTIISYEGNNIEELKADFKNGIDDYLENCSINGEKPEKVNNKLAKSEWNDIFSVGSA